MLITWVLTVLAAVVVVLTRVRLSKEDGAAAGRISIPHSVLNLHTIAGVPALLLWVTFLVTKIEVLGWIAIVLWWVTAIAGLLVLGALDAGQGQALLGPGHGHVGRGPGAVGARARRSARRRRDLHGLPRPRQARLIPCAAAPCPCWPARSGWPAGVSPRPRR